MDGELQQIISHLQVLANRLASEDRLTEAAVVWGGILAIQALRTKLEPPKAAEPKDPEPTPDTAETLNASP